MFVCGCWMGTTRKRERDRQRESDLFAQISALLFFIISLKKCVASEFTRSPLPLGGSIRGRGLGGGVNSGGRSSSFDNSFHDSYSYMNKHFTDRYRLLKVGGMNKK